MSKKELIPTDEEIEQIWDQHKDAIIKFLEEYRNFKTLDSDKGLLAPILLRFFNNFLGDKNKMVALLFLFIFGVGEGTRLNKTKMIFEDNSEDGGNGASN